VPRFAIRYSDRYLHDFLRVDAFDRARIRAAVLLLEEQADVATRNRRPLKRPVSWCPEATWQLRAGDYRVLYRIGGRDVLALRVSLKGSRTTEEMGS
jgi:mRNA-degrading endonuclease RelE of RelBE toxin-antitoxin system